MHLSVSVVYQMYELVAIDVGISPEDPGLPSSATL